MRPDAPGRGPGPESGREPGPEPRSGTGPRAGAGAETVPGYDPHAFPPFGVTVDLAVFTVRDARLNVLLVERGEAPYRGSWALPGGFVRPDESAGQAARRELAEETGLSRDTVHDLHLEQLRTYTDPGRDPRMRVVSIAYAALLPDLPEPRGGGDAAHARWTACADVGAGVGAAAPGGLAFDHDRILADAYDRICAKLEYTGLATGFCPPEFTLGELQRIYETVWGVPLDRPNFRRKVLATPGFVEPVEGPPRRTGGRGKPAALYRAGTAATLHPPLLRPEGRQP
ncbi:NUDIX domain-containing protein [Streptomyces sp. NPDC058953]|uniref:NUDIX hydrolase n=1 Tax=unclassified Streptomyces TaxID=2593676 RepID=UPI003697C749